MYTFLLLWSFIFSLSPVLVVRWTVSASRVMWFHVFVLWEGHPFCLQLWIKWVKSFLQENFPANKFLWLSLYCRSTLKPIFGVKGYDFLISLGYSDPTWDWLWHGSQMERAILLPVLLPPLLEIGLPYGWKWKFVARHMLIHCHSRSLGIWYLPRGVIESFALFC